MAIEAGNTRSGLSKSRYYYLLIGIFLLAELIILPIDNFPLNDDWVYGKTLRDVFLGRDFNLGTSNCTLWTQVMWGLFFTKIFGFSFAVLRLSTLVSSFIGITLLFKIILHLTKNGKLAFLSGFVLLFNPLYFNLSNTFMTDVHFSALLITCCFFAYKFYETKNLFYMILLMLSSLFLVLIRQFGIIVPLCFTFSCFFLKENKLKYLLYAFALTALVFLGFKYYEHFIQVNGRGEYYPFSSKFSLLEAEFWTMFWANFKFRYGHIITQIAVFTLPVIIVYLIHILKTTKWIVTGVCGLFGIALTYLFADVSFPLGNIFVNMNLGAETFYEWLNPDIRPEHGHTYSHNFGSIMHWVKLGSLTVFFTTFFLILVKLRKKVSNLRTVLLAEHVLIVTLILCYVFLLVVAEGFFDRYHIPLFVLIIIAAAYLSRSIDFSITLAFLWVIPLFYVSVFGTKDYFELNRKRWEAYNYLRFQEGIPSYKINAGYEVDDWNDGYFQVFYKGTFVHDVDYLIEYLQVPDFKVYKEYEFQRYFPYKRDKIFIFARVDKLK
ncbi:MAG: glycosyltransferase family 39 protein [Bacteroidia bacterium]|nr:glycosyltransferase family 39 protein [Bacteroidia bacterium]